MSNTISNSYIFSVGTTLTNNNYIDITSLYLKDNNYHLIDIYDGSYTNINTYNNKDFIVSNIPLNELKPSTVEDTTNAITSFNTTNLITAIYKLTNLPVGNYKFSFSRLSGFNNVDAVNNKDIYSDVQYTYYSFYKDAEYSNHIEYLTNNLNSYTFTNTDSNIHLYNIYSLIPLSKNDLMINYRYYPNINDIESIYKFSTKYKTNYTSSIEFSVSNENDSILCVFYVPRLMNENNIIMNEEYYTTYITDFKLEYRMSTK